MYFFLASLCSAYNFSTNTNLKVFIHCMVYLCLSCFVTSFISCNMKINAVLFSVYFKILISILKILTNIFRLKQCVTSHRSDLFFTAMSKNFLASLCSPYLLKSNNHRHNFFMKIPTKCKFQKHVITLKYQGIV